jgi:hypothetical protein|nr:MAG TPA: hypothetical protein [Caudoviricetes sp.]
MARRSIYFNEQSENFVNERTEQGETANYSANVNSAFEMLEHLAKSEKPTLSDEDWMEMYNIYAGSNLMRRVLPLNLAKDLLDYYGATLPRDLPDNCILLVERLADMTQTQQYAVLDAVRIYWASNANE